VSYAIDEQERRYLKEQSAANAITRPSGDQLASTAACMLLNPASLRAPPGRS
jgi:hypothetical protein